MRFNKTTSIAVFLTVTALTYTIVFNRLVSAHFIFPEKEEKTESATYVYTLGEYNGFLAVFEADDKTPVTIYDTPVNILPDSDREMLKEGITAQTMNQLQKIIEDYSS